MKLRLLSKKRFRVASVEEKNAESVEEFLQDASTQWPAYAKGCYALFERYAECGRQGMMADWFHEADKQGEIWQFKKGRLRVYCFLDDGDLIILTHGSIKKSQKADSKQIERAVHLKAQYRRDKALNKIIFLESDRG